VLVHLQKVDRQISKFKPTLQLRGCLACTTKRAGEVRAVLRNHQGGDFSHHQLDCALDQLCFGESAAVMRVYQGCELLDVGIVGIARVEPDIRHWFVVAIRLVLDDT